jgi:hypothetical protein
MMMSAEMMLIATMVLPMAAVVPIVAAHRYANLREAVSIVTALILIYLVVQLYGLTSAGVVVAVASAPLFAGLRLAFAIEPLGMLFSLVASILWLVTTIYAIGYMRGHHEQNQTRFYACFAVAIGSAMGIAYAGNLLTLFVFYEILTLSTYPLVTHAGTAEAKQGGRIYLGILLTTSILFLLAAIIGTWGRHRYPDFRPGGISAPTSPPPPIFCRSISSGSARRQSCPFIAGCPPPWWRLRRCRHCCMRWRWSRRGYLRCSRYPSIPSASICSPFYPPPIFCCTWPPPPLCSPR